MVTPNPMQPNGVAAPGITFGRPGETGQPQSVTIQRLVLGGLAGIGKSACEITQRTRLDESGLLINEVTIMAATCGGCGDLITASESPLATCLWHGLVVCSDCRLRLRCECGRQTCSWCSVMVSRTAIRCRVCQRNHSQGGQTWSSSGNTAMEHFNRPSLPTPAWGLATMLSGISQGSPR